MSTQLRLRGSPVRSFGALVIGESRLGQKCALHRTHTSLSGLASVRALSADVGQVNQDDLIEKLLVTPPYELPGIVVQVCSDQAKAVR